MFGLFLKIGIYNSKRVFTSDTGLCLHFMYMTFGTALRVSLRMNEIAGRILFSDHRYDAIWQEGQASIKQMDEPFMVSKGRNNLALEMPQFNLVNKN